MMSVIHHHVLWIQVSTKFLHPSTDTQHQPLFNPKCGFQQCKVSSLESHETSMGRWQIMHGCFQGAALLYLNLKAACHHSLLQFPFSKGFLYVGVNVYWFISSRTQWHLSFNVLMALVFVIICRLYLCVGWQTWNKIKKKKWLCF